MTGSAAMPRTALDARARRWPAAGSRRARSAPVLAPASCSAVPRARASQAPSSTAAQSWPAARERHEDGPGPWRPRRRRATATSHGASSSSVSSRASSSRPSGASTTSSSTSCSAASRVRSRPGVTDVNAALRAVTPRRPSWARSLGQLAGRRRRARADAGDRRGHDELALDPPASVRAEGQRAAAQRAERERGRHHAARIGGERRDGRRRGARRSERRVLLEDRALEVAQRGARLDAELVDQRRAGRPEGLERVGLAPGAVERQHLQRAEALVQRVLGDQRVELRDQLGVAAAREVGLDPPAPAASRRSSSRRAATVRAHGSSARSDSAGPRQSASAARNSAAASAERPSARACAARGRAALEAPAGPARRRRRQTT